MDDLIQIAGTVLEAETRVRFARGIFSKDITLDLIRYLKMTIRLEGMVTA